MKISKSYLKQIIKEELQKVSEDMASLPSNLPKIPNETIKLSDEQSESFVNDVSTHKFNLEDLMQSIRYLPALKSEYRASARNNLFINVKNNGFKEQLAIRQSDPVTFSKITSYLQNDFGKLLSIADFKQAEAATQQLATDLASHGLKY